MLGPDRVKSKIPRLPEGSVQDNLSKRSQSIKMAEEAARPAQQVR